MIQRNEKYQLYSYLICFHIYAIIKKPERHFLTYKFWKTFKSIFYNYYKNSKQQVIFIRGLNSRVFESNNYFLNRMALTGYLVPLWKVYWIFRSRITSALSDFEEVSFTWRWSYMADLNALIYLFISANWNL